MKVSPFGHCHKKHKMLKMKYKGHHHQGCHYKIKGCPSFLETEMRPDFQKRCHKMKKCHKMGKHHGDTEGRSCFIKHHDRGHHGVHRGGHGHHHDNSDGYHQGGPHGHHHGGRQSGPQFRGGHHHVRKNCGCENRSNESECRQFRGHGRHGRCHRGGMFQTQDSGQKKDCGNCSGNEQNQQTVVHPPCCQQRSKSV